ncbi:hypothetical protein THASP1DRAFT_24198 [Thamnocephalis sphaerospora]|uniref:Uncharacterized protein n=1 Tax=Thamnocephalis sphaerospora TaxID=78915 RepID=A0A4P9XNY7_9FUNG|nr:hypothetical protein THASP1DRAFT_24198 [Thamnocephalis sphaerospora]|eukprot:RKP07696.1 hypothetical protein THASP1DRAFT_24198 [Thamnocephalis sphaerospora]
MKTSQHFALLAMAAMLIVGVAADSKQVEKKDASQVMYAPSGTASAAGGAPSQVLYAPILPVEPVAPVAPVAPVPVAPAPEQAPNTVVVSTTTTEVVTETASPTSGAANLDASGNGMLGLAAVGAAYAGYALF